MINNPIVKLNKEKLLPKNTQIASSPVSRKQPRLTDKSKCKPDTESLLDEILATLTFVHCLASLPAGH